MNRPSPAEAWASMEAGNMRFVAGTPEHPRQDAERREQLAHEQHPWVALFGCSDSRLAAEIIFDKGLGDLFVIRNAGQVVSHSVIGSLEYAVEVLGSSLIVVLAHDECGAVNAAIRSLEPEPAPLPPHIAAQIRPIVPAVQRVWLAEHPRTPYVDPELIDSHKVGLAHLQETIARILQESELISERVADGSLGIVGATYRLVVGRAEAEIMIGDFGEQQPVAH